MPRSIGTTHATPVFRRTWFLFSMVLLLLAAGTAFAAPLNIKTSSLPSGIVGTAYSQSLTASGGKTPYAWSITAGALPAGLSLNALSGVISGTPTVVGSNTFTVQVKDANNVTATKSLSITINAGSLTITTTILPDGYVGTAYSQTLTATGGKTPYTWSITAGTLPSGLSLNASSGVISGVPTDAGSSAFTVRVTDNNSATASKSLTIVIYTNPAITTTGFPDGFIGTPYSQTLTATGGKTPYTWSIIAGVLPAGLSLNTSTGEYQRHTDHRRKQRIYGSSYGQ